jgi:glycosyltransferase involved in cell wall biosynthesis
LGQSFKPQEVIVVDDKSTDDSVEIIEKFVGRDESIKLLKNENNVGVVNTANRGLKYATGEYVFFLAADDKVLPGFFEKSMNMLQLYPQSGLCCSDLVHFNDQKGSGRIKSFKLGRSLCYISSDDIIRRMRRKCTIINSGSCIMKRSALLRVGGFIPELRWNCDWFAVYALIFKHGFCYIPEPLVAQRILKNSYSSIGGNNWKSQKEIAFNIMHVLESSSYKDLLDIFKRTYSLAIFGMPMLSVLLSHKKYHRFLSLVMILRIVRYEIKKFLGFNIPFSLKMIYYDLQKIKYKGFL